MAGYTQDTRFLSVTSPLGKDVLLLTGFSGRESLSELFTFQLDLLSEKGDVAAKDIVGKAVGWTVHLAERDPRHFHGHISRLSARKRCSRSAASTLRRRGMPRNEK